MDVDAFTTKHTPEWQRLAEATNGGAPGLARLGGARIDEIVSLYLRVSGHLAEVQTRYHDPSLEAYLTQVVSQAHGAIYGGEPRSVRSLVRLFGSQYREALRRTMPFIAVMAALFVVVALSTGARAVPKPGCFRGRRITRRSELRSEYRIEGEPRGETGPSFRRVRACGPGDVRPARQNCGLRR